MPGRSLLKRAKTMEGRNEEQICIAPSSSSNTMPQRTRSEPVIQLACTTGPTQLRSVLRTPRRTASADALPSPLLPLFTSAPLVSPTSPPPMPMIRDETELEYLEFPLSLDDHFDETTPCPSILATPHLTHHAASAFPSTSSSMNISGHQNEVNHFDYGYQAYHGYHYSNAKSYGSKSCECEVECIDPSLCSQSYVTFGSSFADANNDARFNFDEQDEDDQGVGCSWAASPPKTSHMSPSPVSASASAAASLSSYKQPFAWLARRASASSLLSDEDGDKEQSVSVASDDDDDVAEEANSRSPALVDLFEACGSLIDYEFEPTLRTRPAVTKATVPQCPIEKPMTESLEVREPGPLVKRLDFARCQLSPSRPHQSGLTASAPASITDKRLSPVQEA